MSKVKLIKLAKKIKNFTTGVDTTPYISYARRINYVKTSARVCAMTFDDGPMRLPKHNATDNTPLTLTLLEILEKHNAHGTFDVIGSTKANYPDTEGKIGTPSWSGNSYDHYPSFSMDDFGGAENCPDLIERILSGGHQITNHTYSHTLYSKKNFIYSDRVTLNSFHKAYDDFEKLDSLLFEKHNYKMSFSRPPHYVDKICKGITAYDLYSFKNYNYLGASFDGAGWLPCKTYDEELDAMVSPLENALKNDPNALCGQIIFQKDGYNMSLRTPIADALDKQLEILDYYGYKVVTVDELVRTYPFSDVDEYDDDFNLFSSLSKKYPIVFSDNCIRPDTPMTVGELLMLVSPKKYSVDKRIEAVIKREKPCGHITPYNKYYGAALYAKEQNLLTINSKQQLKKNVTFSDFENLKAFFDISTLKNTDLTRRNIIKALKLN